MIDVRAWSSYDNAAVTNLNVFVDAIDHSYNSSTSDSEWLRVLLETLAPELDYGHGMCAWFYDISNISDLKLFYPTVLGAPENMLEAVLASAFHPKMPRLLLHKHWATPAGAMSEIVGEGVEGFVPWRDTLYQANIRDIVTINAYDTDGCGMAVNAFASRRIRLPQSYVEQLERVAVHLIAAYRIRRKPGTIEAMVEPDGTVVHAGGKAISRSAAISLAARSIARARGPLRRRAPIEALAAWHALVDARWSLVDFIDSDGMRFLVARVNSLETPKQSKLTAREAQVVALVTRGHSSKLIAYELGIEEGTVAAHISAAVHKLGVTGRAGLVALYADPVNGDLDETAGE